MLVPRMFAASHQYESDTTRDVPTRVGMAALRHKPRHRLLDRDSCPGALAKGGGGGVRPIPLRLLKARELFVIICDFLIMLASIISGRDLLTNSELTNVLHAVIGLVGESR